MNLKLEKRTDGWHVVSTFVEAGPYDTEHKARTVRSRVRAEGWGWCMKRRSRPETYESDGWNP
jgi:hypothetical protein